MVPPCFTAPSRVRPRYCGVFAFAKPLTAGRGNGRTRRRLRTLALRLRSSETIFDPLFPARFHRRGSLDGSMRKPTLLFTANLVILSELYANRGDLSTGKTKFFGGKRKSFLCGRCAMDPDYVKEAFVRESCRFSCAAGCFFSCFLLFLLLALGSSVWNRLPVGNRPQGKTASGPLRRSAPPHTLQSPWHCPGCGRRAGRRGWSGSACSRRR